VVKVEFEEFGKEGQDEREGDLDTLATLAEGRSEMT
jgi:hypothetical protein